MCSLRSIPALTVSQSAICFAANTQTSITSELGEITKQFEAITGGFRHETKLHLMDDLAKFVRKDPVGFQQKLKGIVDKKTGSLSQGRFLPGEEVTGKTVVLEVLETEGIIIRYVSNGIPSSTAELAN